MGQGKGGKGKYKKPDNPNKKSGGFGTNPQRASKGQDSTKVHNSKGKNNHGRTNWSGLLGF